MSVFDDLALYIRRRVRVLDTGCWEWQGQLDKNGYGMFRRRAKAPWEKAYRRSYEAFVGKIPAGLHVLHRCHNRRCVNPAHLYAGTHKQNQEDRSELIRSRLVAIAKEIIPSDQKGRSCYAIAKKYGVGRRTLREVYLALHA